jgi:hypothetical protein
MKDVELYGQVRHAVQIEGLNQREAKRDQEGSPWPLPLALLAPTAEHEQHDDDDQDHAEDANPTARSVVGISVITSTEAAKKEQQDDDDQD